MGEEEAASSYTLPVTYLGGQGTNSPLEPQFQCPRRMWGPQVFDWVGLWVAVLGRTSPGLLTGPAYLGLPVGEPGLPKRVFISGKMDGLGC